MKLYFSNYIFADFFSSSLLFDKEYEWNISGVKFSYIFSLLFSNIITVAVILGFLITSFT